MSAFQILAQSAGPAVMISWWKMVLVIPPFLGWGWLISAKLDKDARVHHLNATMWNSVHLGAGVAALAAFLFVPIFWAGLPVAVAILITPILVYWRVRNEAVSVEQQFYLSGATIAERLESRRVKKAARAALVHFTNYQGTELPAPMKDEPHYAIHMLAEDFFGPAIEQRATRVEMMITPKGTGVSFTVDGVKFKSDPMATEDSLKVCDYIKDIAGLDVEDRRKKQRGACTVHGPEGKNALTITTAGSSQGQSLRIDLDLSKQIDRPFEKLGLLPSQLTMLLSTEAVHDRHGTILVGAPRGHGLTTTCYAFVGRHDAYISNIKSLEREILLQMDGPDQIQFDPTNPDVDYPTNLQSIIRRDPDVVLTDELQDTESAQIIAESGLDGPLCYVPQGLPSIVEQIRAWVKLVGDVKEATRSLRMVTNQRLLRKLCPNCKQAFTPTAEQLKKLNLPPSKVKELHRAGGKIEIKGKVEPCNICRGTGFMGLTAAFEVLDITPDICKVLSTGDLKAALTLARRNKMIYLQEAAMSKVVAGETSVEEVVRVTSPAKEAKKGPSAAA